jgi:transposase-like protein
MLRHADEANGKQPGEVPDPEVVVRARRRQFSAAYKLRILQEADGCQERGQIGALLRREGLYSSHLSTWRKQRAVGELTDKQRGRKGDPAAAEMKRLQRENERLRQELEKARLIIEVQKKLSQALGLTMPDTSGTGESE